jgi:cytochrome c biogenesis protein CcmG/thiol:disulfide interchange protein DsbE
MARYFLPLGIFAALVVLLAVGLTLNPRLVPSPLIDKPAPAFTLPDVKDPQHTVSRADLEGKVSLVNVWASWCVSCRAEHPLFMELARAGIVPVYGINYKDERPDALRWLEAFGDPYVVSAYDYSGRVGIEWGVYGTPETFLVDRNGIIRYKHVGPVTVQDLERKILPRIKELQEEKS